MHNKTMSLWLAETTGAKVGRVEELGWTGDALEAEGWAYLAVRSLLGLPLTLPNITGCPRPVLGGKLEKKSSETINR
jgi:anhydro-N-acetylmuramic acid kinase